MHISASDYYQTTPRSCSARRASHLTTAVAGIGGNTTATSATENSYRISTTVKASELWCCCCNCTSARSTKAPGYLACLGICVLVFGYTLLGAFAFMALEGGFKSDLASDIVRFTGSSSKSGIVNTQREDSNPLLPSSDEEEISARELRTYYVDRLWSLTEDLNVLYKENWTILAEREILELQEKMAKSLHRGSSISVYGGKIQRSPRGHDRRGGFVGDRRWTFGSSLLYSLTLITTIGYGSIAPRTVWGRVITIVYALAGIPLMLVYLSTVGDVLARAFRRLYGRLCHRNNHSGEKQKPSGGQFIVPPPTMSGLMGTSYHRYDNHIETKLPPGNFYSSKDSSCDELGVRATGGAILLDRDGLDGNFYLHTTSASPGNMMQESEKRHLHACTQMSLMPSAVNYGANPICVVRIPISLCLFIILLYICGGAYLFHRFEGWSLLESSYFCFTSLGTIGFGDLVPLGRKAQSKLLEELSLCACSLYILVGMGLIAMCFNLVQEEVVRAAGVFGRTCGTEGIPVNSFGANGYKSELCEDGGIIGSGLPENCRQGNDHEDDGIAMTMVSAS